MACGFKELQVIVVRKAWWGNSDHSGENVWQTIHILEDHEAENKAKTKI